MGTLAIRKSANERKLDVDGFLVVHDIISTI